MSVRYCHMPGCTLHGVRFDGDGNLVCINHAILLGLEPPAPQSFGTPTTLAALREALR